MTWTRFRELYRTRRSVRWTVDVLALLGVLFIAGLWQTRNHVRGEAPAFSFASLEGGAPVSRASLEGRPTMLVFWAPWCTVCRAESKNISWVRSLAGARANVVSIAASYQNTADVTAYVREQGVDYPVLLGDDSVAERFAISAYPTVYFLDSKGRISSSVVGYSTTAGLLLRLLLATT
jgi:thiol-disulfide isomerase/thioredoxin